jgi:predicted membrane-bound mannosyltransferase
MPPRIRLPSFLHFQSFNESNSKSKSNTFQLKSNPRSKFLDYFNKYLHSLITAMIISNILDTVSYLLNEPFKNECSFMVFFFFFFFFFCIHIRNSYYNLCDDKQSNDYVLSQFLITIFDISQHFEVYVLLM